MYLAWVKILQNVLGATFLTHTVTVDYAVRPKRLSIQSLIRSPNLEDDNYERSALLRVGKNRFFRKSF